MKISSNFVIIFGIENLPPFTVLFVFLLSFNGTNDASAPEQMSTNFFEKKRSRDGVELSWVEFSFSHSHLFRYFSDKEKSFETESSTFGNLHLCKKLKATSNARILKSKDNLSELFILKTSFQKAQIEIQNCDYS